MSKKLFRYVQNDGEYSQWYPDENRMNEDLLIDMDCTGFMLQDSSMENFWIKIECKENDIKKELYRYVLKFNKATGKKEWVKEINHE